VQQKKEGREEKTVTGWLGETSSLASKKRLFNK
jgi:hypothetical protein